MSHLNEKGVKYKELNDECVEVSYNADNSSFSIKVIFDKDGEGLVAFRCWSIGGFAEDKYAKALIVCNEMNVKYRWVKFYLDSDRDVTVASDAIVDIATVGAECLQMVRRMVNICDEAYPSFMRVKWA